MEKNKNRPELRFPEFEGEWKRKKLGDIGKVKMCKRVFSNETTANGDIPFYKIGTFGKEPDAFITKELYEEYRNKFSFPKVGEILISAAGTLGRTVVYDGEPSYYQDSNIVWLDNSEILTYNDFLFYVYQIIQYESEGGTIQRLYNSIISNAIYYNPTLPEQQKIASFLTAVDEKLTALKKKKELLEQYKKGVMQKLFSQQIRFKPALSEVEGDDKGKEFPKWNYKHGNEIFDSISDKNHHSDLPILAITQEHGAIPRELIDYNISVTEASVDSYKVVQKGDFIISLRSFQGGIEYSEYKGICSPAYIILRPKISIDDRFYKYYLKTESYIKELNKKLEGIRDGKMISYKYFSEVKLPYPSIEEQTKIANFLTAIDQKINQCQQQIEQTTQWKKGLLQKMFV
ncbi:MAG: restriction endonuclease subunit S [Prolixibacteraceae bacterium]|nr:restriction endonuclease subunit S [Prolixibacteraceae bacterium]